MDEVEVVILRFGLGICSPGCLHLVLESISPRAPYLLENRTAHPFQYKQAGLGELAYLVQQPWGPARELKEVLCTTGLVGYA